MASRTSSVGANLPFQASEYAKYDKYTKRAGCLFTLGALGGIILGIYAISYHLQVISISCHDASYEDLVSDGWAYFTGSMACAAVALIALPFFIYNYGERARHEGEKRARIKNQLSGDL